MIWRISRKSSCDAIRPIVRRGTPHGARAVGPTSAPTREGWPGSGGWPVSFDPDRPPRAAPALWRADTAASVVTLISAPPGFAAAAPLPPAIAPIADATDAGGRHLVIDTPSCRNRLWLLGTEPGAALVILLAPTRHPVRVAAADAARCLMAGVPRLFGTAALSPTRLQHRRLVLLLDILDARLAGASTREVATTLLYPWLADIPALAWTASSERRRTQRMIAEARGLMQGGYRALLSGR
nr:DUF2285 domain-containing protein [Sphingomonas glacialis]